MVKRKKNDAYERSVCLSCSKPIQKWKQGGSWYHSGDSGDRELGRLCTRLKW